MKFACKYHCDSARPQARDTFVTAFRQALSFGPLAAPAEWAARGTEGPPRHRHPLAVWKFFHADAAPQIMAQSCARTRAHRRRSELKMTGHRGMAVHLGGPSSDQQQSAPQRRIVQERLAGLHTEVSIMHFHSLQLRTIRSGSLFDIPLPSVRHRRYAAQGLGIHFQEPRLTAIYSDR